MTTNIRTRFAWMLVTVLACGLAGSSSSAADEATASGTSSITGKIVSGPKKTPLAGATVLAYHLATATIFRSPPTGEDGRFEITELTHGYYDMAVEAIDGMYVGNQVVNVPPDGRAVSNFNLQPVGPGQTGARDFPGSDRPTTGIASFVDKSFWRTPKGIAIWSGSTAAAIGLAIGLSGDSSSATVSCSMPPCTP